MLGLKFAVQSGPDYNALTNLQRLVAGEVDLAIGQNEMPDEENLSDTAVRAVRTIMPLYPELLFIIYKDSLHPTSLRDLFVGRRVALGPRTGGAARMLHRYLDAQGIDSSLYTPVYSSYAERALSDSADICCALTGFTNPSIREMLERKGGRIFSLDDPALAGKGSSVDGFCLSYLGARPYIIPRNAYGSAPERPVLTLAVDAVLLGRSDLDPAFVYDLAGALLAQHHLLAKDDPILIALGDRFDPNILYFPPHEGMRMYLDRNAPSYLERYSSVFGLILSLVLALAGGISALLGWRARRRKNRIDVYYRRLLDIESSVSSTAEPARLHRALADVREVRAEAYALLIDERIAADESFTIFMAMSESVSAGIREALHGKA